MPVASPLSGITHWRRVVLAIWIALFATQFGIGFANPFFPLFLQRDLGVRDPRELAVWSGLAAGGSGIVAFFVLPLWGVVADRYGRKPMVLRAMLGIGTLTVVSGLVVNAVELVAARMVMGATVGVNTFGTAMVADAAPRARIGWALGMTSSARSLGQAVGPIVGGVLATLLPLRIVFALGGLLVLTMSIPTVVLLREAPIAGGDRSHVGVRQVLHAAGPRTTLSLLVVIVCQSLAWFAYVGAQPLVVLRILQISPGGTAFATGLTFAALGVATAIAAVTYSGLLPRLGFRLLAALSCCVMTAGLVGLAMAPSVAWLLFATAFVGLTFGALNPTLTSMLGLEAPSAIKASVFGVGASFVALGSGAGPILGGFAAGALGVRAGLMALALVPLVAALIVWWKGREPNLAEVQRTQSPSIGS